MRQYRITYAITNEESADSGDFAEYGEIDTCDNLRDALKELYGTRTSHVDGVRDQTGSYAEHGKRLTLAVFNGMEFLTGDEEQRGLHLHGVSRASAQRIARLVGIRLDDF